MTENKNTVEIVVERVHSAFPNVELLTMAFDQGIKLDYPGTILQKANQWIRTHLCEEYCSKQLEMYSSKRRNDKIACPYIHEAAEKKSRLGTSTNYSLCFGTRDMATVLPLCHSLSSSIYRTSLINQENVTSLLGYPASRIDLSKSCRNYHPDEKLSESPRFVAYTFFHRPIRRNMLTQASSDENSDKTTKNKAEKLQVTIQSICREHMRYKSLESRLNTKIPLHPELFLTFSTAFPYMLKSEHATLEQLIGFLLRVDDEIDHVNQISTVLAWFDPQHMALQTDSETPPPPKNETIPALEAKAATQRYNFRLLVKCRGTLITTSEDLKKLFEKKQIEVRNILPATEEKGETWWLPRPYFWDFFMVVRTADVFGLLETIAKIREREDVSAVATMPLLSPNPDMPEEDLRKLKEYKSSKKEEHLKYLHSQFQDLASVYNEIRKRNWTNFDRHWKNFVPHVFKHMQETTRQTGVELFFNQQWINLFQELNWVIGCIAQLREAWHHQVYLRGLDGNRKSPPTTFDLMEKRLKCWLTDTLDSSEHPGIEHYRNGIRLVQRSEKALRNITAELNEKTEGLQAVRSSDNLVRIGETTGVIDMVVESIGRLFRHYCSRPNTESTLAWAETPKRLEWNGIVCSSTGDDFSLNTEWRLLYLPAGSKFIGLEYASYLMVAHEACHQIAHMIDLYEEFYKQDTFDPLQEENHGERKILKEIRTDFDENVWNDLCEACNRTEEETLGNRRLECSNKVLRSKRICLDRFEFLSDILASITAGPAYLKCLIANAFEESDSIQRVFNRKRMRLGSIHPPLWLRTLILYTTYLKLGWIERDCFDCDSSIQHYWNNIFSHEPPFVPGKRSQSLETYLAPLLSDIEQRDFESASMKLGSYIRALGRESSYRKYIWPEHFILLTLFHENGLDWLKKLVCWCSINGNRFLFFPLSKNHDWENYSLTVRAVNDYCCDLSERMLKNSEIILNAPLKYIAAVGVSFGLEYQMPYVNQFRILHSLYYSDDKEGYELLSKHMQDYFTKDRERIAR